MRFKKLARLLFEDAAYVILSDTEPKDKSKLLGTIDTSDEKIMKTLKNVVAVTGIDAPLRKYLETKNFTDSTSVHFKEVFNKLKVLLYDDLKEPEEAQKFFNALGKSKLNKTAGTFSELINGDIDKTVALKTIGIKGSKEPVMGGAEAFLLLFTDAQKAKRGDLLTAGGKTLEVKGRSGRLAGSGEYNSPEKFLTTIGIPNKKEISVIDIPNIITKIKALDDKKLQSIIPLMKQQDSSATFGKDWIEALKDVNDSSDFRAFLTAVQMKSYASKEGIEEIFLFNDEKKKSKWLLIDLSGSSKDIISIVKDNITDVISSWKGTSNKRSIEVTLK